jgi:hypothetical protein
MSSKAIASLAPSDGAQEPSLIRREGVEGERVTRLGLLGQPRADHRSPVNILSEALPSVDVAECAVRDRDGLRAVDLAGVVADVATGALPLRRGVPLEAIRGVVVDRRASRPGSLDCGALGLAGRSGRGCLGGGGSGQSEQCGQWIVSLSGRLPSDRLSENERVGFGVETGSAERLRVHAGEREEGEILNGCNLSRGELSQGDLPFYELWAPLADFRAVLSVGTLLGFVGCQHYVAGHSWAFSL